MALSQDMTADDAREWFRVRHGRKVDTMIIGEETVRRGPEEVNAEARPIKVGRRGVYLASMARVIAVTESTLVIEFGDGERVINVITYFDPLIVR